TSHIQHVLFLQAELRASRNTVPGSANSRPGPGSGPGILAKSGPGPARARQPRPGFYLQISLTHFLATKKCFAVFAKELHFLQKNKDLHTTFTRSKVYRHII